MVVKVLNQAAPVLGFAFLLLFLWIGCEEREPRGGRRN